MTPEQHPAQPSGEHETTTPTSCRLDDDSYIQDAALIYSRHILTEDERAAFEHDVPGLIEEFSDRYIGSYSHPEAFIDESVKRLGWEQTIRIAASQGRFPIGIIALDHEAIYDYLSRYYRIIADAGHQVIEGMPVIHVYAKPGVKPPKADCFETSDDEA